MRQWTVDAFASAPFRGNPACVVEPFDAWPDAAWMQALAAENNQAETAFLLKSEHPAHFGLRWFTPTVEVPLCGHATLASGHVLFEALNTGAGPVTFDTQSGPLTVSRRNGGYEMDFPSQPPQRIPTPAGLAAALGVEPAEVWVAPYLIVVLADEAAVRGLAPDLRALAGLGVEASGSPGNIGVTAPAADGAPYDVVSRFFAPGSGIDEDPATGSMHCILAPLWSGKLGRATVRYFQAYPGRGAELECETAGDRVKLRGTAVTVLDSVLRL